MTLDTNSLRKDLIDYYGTAMSNGFPMAVIDLEKAERASDQEIIEMAREEGVDLSQYQNDY